MIILKSIKQKEFKKTGKIEFFFEIKGTTRSIWFTRKIKYYNNLNTASANIFLSSILLPAMKTGEDIDINNHYLSKSFLDSLEKIQCQYLLFFPEKKLNKIRVTNFRIEIVSDCPITYPITTASFFTCGVDSFDTLISNNSIIERLIYVYGFDINRKDRELIKAVNKQFKIINKSFEKEFIFITTNLREFSEEYVTWDAMHGSALVAIGYLFEGMIKTILIPGGNSVDLTVPSGSHPNLEPNFSSEKISFICDGSDKKRIDKIINIKQSRIALENLRVCWKNAGNKLNCGVCEKCIRTMLALSIADVLGQTKTFSKTLDSAAISSIKISNDIVASFYREMLPYLKGKPILRQAKKHLLQELDLFDNRQKTLPKPIIKNKNILFIDFNGVISYEPFWFSLKNNEKYSKDFELIENFLFKQNRKIISDWMLGGYSTEDVHNILQKELNIPAEIISIFKKDCENLDISSKILQKVNELRKFYYCILATDNMDSFVRFTLPNRKELTESFDEINDSYTMKQCKSSFDGLYFKKKITEKRAIIENSILIDDSPNNCKVFESIGGQSYQVKNENDVLKALSSILSKVENKWEWQY